MPGALYNIKRLDELICLKYIPRQDWVNNLWNPVQNEKCGFPCSKTREMAPLNVLKYKDFSFLLQCLIQLMIFSTGFSMSF